jgi:hypothetical protein
LTAEERRFEDIFDAFPVDVAADFRSAIVVSCGCGKLAAVVVVVEGESK